MPLRLRPGAAILRPACRGRRAGGSGRPEQGEAAAVSELNVKPSTIFCHDNIDVLRGMNSGCIDLIYLDPPFNKNKVFTAPIGSAAEGASFSDIFREEDVKDEWVTSIMQDSPELYTLLSGVKTFSNRYNYCYCVYMSIRLLECRRLLKDDGSIYYHCDQTMSHYIKLLMDCIFGEKSFKNEITWRRSHSHNDSRTFGRIADTILFYSFQPSLYADHVRTPLDEAAIKARYTNEDERGRYMTSPLHARGLAGGGYHYAFHGKQGPWKFPQERMLQLEKEGRLHFPAKGDAIRRKVYLSEHRGLLPANIWTDIAPLSAAESTGYPTQKPLALLERIIRASSKEGDLVLDPFCGCATACVAAETLGRQWIGIDVSEEAHHQVKARLKKEVPPDMYRGEPNFRVTPPKRDADDMGQGLAKFVYIISNKRYPGEYKVGVATDVQRRLNTYQTSDPDRAFKVEFQKQTPHYNDIEKAIHAQFDNKHEWVRGDLDEIARAIIEWRPKQDSLL